MKNIGMFKLQHLLYVLLMLAMTGCGASNSTTAAAPAGNGAVAAKLVWGGQAKSAAKTVAAIPVGVAKIRMTVSGAGVPVVRNEIDVTGGATSGTVSGIYPGTVSLVVEALDASGAKLYEGFALNIVVKAGATTDVGTITMTVPTVKAADLPCLGCHETTLNHPGQNLIAEFKQSGHYTNLAWSANAKFGVTGTGCAGCHGPNHNDTNPAGNGRCFECHGALGIEHLNAGSTGNATPARYLNATNSNCSACHEPHNPIEGAGKQERRDWAASGHGDTHGPAWEHYDFTTRDTCNACHTTTGFIKAMGNGHTNTLKLGATSTGKEVLACNGCHLSNDFKNGGVRKTSGGYVAGMGGYGAAAKATISFPDVGDSNLCIPCHAGRENGASMQGTLAAPTNFANSTFKNPHYLAAAAVFYGKGGFQFYTSGVRYNTYGAAGKVGKGANWSHGRLGMDNYTTTTNTTVKASGVIYGSGNSGQCVACHLGPKNTHTFGALQVANATAGTSSYTRGCYGCHTGTDIDMNAFIEEEKEIWQRLFHFFNWNFVYNADGTQRTTPIYYNELANPYFFSDPAGTVSLTNWTLTVPGGTGKETMGAAMNYKLLKAEKGSFVHNRAFGRALIADSIVYLQKGTVGDRTVVYPSHNGVINFSNYSTAFPTSYPGQVGPDVSISTIKSYLTRSATGGYTRR